MENKILPQNLTYLRKKHNLTTKQLSQAIKVTEETIVGWEIGLTQPGVKDVIKLSNFYQVEARDLVNNDLGPTQKQIKQENLKAESKGKHKSLIIMYAVVLALSVLTFIMFSARCYEIEYTNVTYYQTFFNMLGGEGFSVFKFFCWLILLIVVFNVVNSIIFLSSRRIRNSGYNKVGKILTYSLNAAAILMWIVTLVQYDSSEYIAAGAILIPLLLFAIIGLVLGFDIAQIVKNRKSQNEETSKKSTQATNVSKRNGATKKSNQIKNLGPQKSSLVSYIFILLFSFLAILSFSVDWVYIRSVDTDLNFGLYNLVDISNSDLLKLVWYAIVAILVFNVVNSLICIISKKVRNSSYGKVSKILTYVLNALLLLGFISILLSWNNGNMDYELRDGAGIFLIGSTGILLSMLAYDIAPKHTNRVTTVALNFNALNCALIVGIVFEVFGDKSWGANLLLLFIAGLLLSANVALFISPVYENKAARIVLSILSFTLTVAMTIPVWFTLDSSLRILSAFFLSISAIVFASLMIFVKKNKATNIVKK